MSSRSSNPRVLGPTVSKKATGKIGGRSRRRVPSAAERSYIGIGAGLNEHLYSGNREIRVPFSEPAPLTIFLGVPPPRCTTVPPCGHCWYCDVYKVQNS